MGRRSAGRRSAPVEPWPRRALRVLGRWTGRLLLSAGAGAVVLVALRWSGVSWPAARWLTLATVLVVLAASGLAGTLPAPPPPAPTPPRGPRPDRR